MQKKAPIDQIEVLQWIQDVILSCTTVEQFDNAYFNLFGNYKETVGPEYALYVQSIEEVSFQRLIFLSGTFLNRIVNLGV